MSNIKSNRGPCGIPNRPRKVTGHSELGGRTVTHYGDAVPGPTRRQREAEDRKRQAAARFRMEPELSGTFLDTASARIGAHRETISGLVGKTREEQQTNAMRATVNARNAASDATHIKRDEMRTLPTGERVNVPYRVNLSDPFTFARAETHARLGLDIGAVRLSDR